MTMIKRGSGWIHADDGGSDALTEARARLREAFELADHQLGVAIARQVIDEMLDRKAETKRRSKRKQVIDELLDRKAKRKAQPRAKRKAKA